MGSKQRAQTDFLLEAAWDPWVGFRPIVNGDTRRATCERVVGRVLALGDLLGVGKEGSQLSSSLISSFYLVLLLR